jgi:hypothetical protein
MLQDAYWSLNEYSPDRMYAAVGFMSFLPRDEVSAALEHRIAQIEAAKIGLSFKEQALRNHRRSPSTRRRSCGWAWLGSTASWGGRASSSRRSATAPICSPARAIPQV